MDLIIYCAMCGKAKDVAIKVRAVDAETTLRKVIDDAGWITQINGDNFDMYCSKKCAS